MKDSMKKREIKLAENLKRVMATKNLNITATAKKAGMHKSTLHGYCNGVIPRNLLQLRDLADFLEISMADLIFSRVDDASPPNTNGGFEGRFEVVVRRIEETEKEEKR